jgi:hypothetical protein
MNAPGLASASHYLAIYWRALLGLILAYLLVSVFWLDAAFAQGVVEADQSFRCIGATATGQLFNLSPNCQSVIGGPGNPIDIQHIFSFLVCNVETLTTALFGNLYCGVIRSLEPAIYAVTTLAVVFFGIGFTTGIIDFTAKEMLTFLVKIALFIAFTTEADYMIGITFRFFVTGAQEGVAIAVSTLFDNVEGNEFASGQDLYFFLDNFFYQFISQTSIAVGASAEAGQNPCKNAIFAALGLLAVAFPPIFLIGIMILMKIAIVFVRGVYGYMFSIVGLAFLMVLSPIYLTFGLFKQTKPWFDKFLGYLVSFSLQMVLVFAFLAFVLSMPLSHVPGSLFNIIVYQQTTYEGNTWRWPWEYCSICDYDIYDINGTPDDTSDDRLLEKGVKVNPASHRLQCKQPPRALEPLAMVSPQPDGTGENPVAQSQKLQSVLLDFAMYGLLSLLVLALVVDQILTYIPYLAQTLGSAMGGGFSPQIAGGVALTGKASVQLPFESSIGATADGFMGGYSRGSGGLGVPRDSITATAAGIAEGSKSLLSGTQRGMVEWLFDPQRGTTNLD